MKSYSHTRRAVDDWEATQGARDAILQRATTREDLDYYTSIVDVATALMQFAFWRDTRDVNPMYKCRLMGSSSIHAVALRARGNTVSSAGPEKGRTRGPQK